MKFRYYIINHHHHHHHEGLGYDIVRKKVEVETAEEVLRIDNYLKLNGDKSTNDDEVSDSWNGDDDNDDDDDDDDSDSERCCSDDESWAC